MRRVAPLAAAVCLATGCGIGSTDTVEEIRPEDLAAIDPTSTISTTTLPPVESTVESVPAIVDTTPPSGPLPSTTAPPPVTTVAEPTELVGLYFVNGSEIVRVETPVLAAVAERRIMDALGLGPPPAEFEAGVRTAVPPELVVGLRTAPVGGLITVNLDGELFHGIDSDNQRYVVAQIVLTLTDLERITPQPFTHVLFTLDGDPLRVYQRDGELTEPGEPVTREDYSELLANG